MALRHDDLDRPLSQAGNTFIDKNGKAAVLTGTAAMEGYSQGLYGKKYGDRTLQHGDICDVWHGGKTNSNLPCVIFNNH